MMKLPQTFSVPCAQLVHHDGGQRPGALLQLQPGLVQRFEEFFARRIAIGRSGRRRVYGELNVVARPVNPVISGTLVIPSLPSPITAEERI